MGGVLVWGLVGGGLLGHGCNTTEKVNDGSTILCLFYPTTFHSYKVHKSKRAGPADASADIVEATAQKNQWIETVQ